MKTNEILRKLREEKELSQYEMAKHLNIRQQTYSNYEIGKSQIPNCSLIKIAKYHNVSIDYLLGVSTFRQPLEELQKVYTLGETLGEVTSDLTKLSQEERKTIIELINLLIKKERT